MHGADVEGVGLPALPQAEAELFVWCSQRPFLAGQKKNRCCTNHPDLPTCKTEAKDLGLRQRNQDSLHVLYASQAALEYTVPKPKYKQASLGNSTPSLIERGVEPLGNLNKGFTVRTTRGLPFNASYACTFMHEFCNHVYQSHFHTQITNCTKGWPLLGLPTLLTAGEREQGGVEIETQASKSFMPMCVCLITLNFPPIICNLLIYPSIERKRCCTARTRRHETSYVHAAYETSKPVVST